MQVKDPTEWFDDLSVHIDDEELIEQAAALEPTLLHGGSRIGAAVWISLVSAIAGAFGGFTFSDEVRSSWLIFIPYLIGGALLLRVLNPLSTRLVGPTVAWQAILAFFWSFLLAMVAVLGSRIDTVWLCYTVSVGGGLFIGLMYGSFSPGFVSTRGRLAARGAAARCTRARGRPPPFNERSMPAPILPGRRRSSARWRPRCSWCPWPS